MPSTDLPKVVATKMDSIKCWVFTNKSLTYFGEVAQGNNDVKWRAAYNPKRVFDALDTITSSDKSAEEKSKLVSQALKSRTSPVFPLPFSVQLGGEDTSLSSQTPDVSGAEVVVHEPAVKTKFPKKKKQDVDE